MIRPPSNMPPNGPLNPNNLSNEEWEEALRQSVRTLPYPPTPDIADRVMARLGNERTPPRWQFQPLWVAALILAFLLGLWAVPPVRAAILEFLQIGAVRIWLVEPTPTTATFERETTATVPSSSIVAPTQQGVIATSTPLTSPLGLAGKTTLAEAEAQAGFSVRLPTYPTDLGQPDVVFYQELAGPTIVLVWMNPEQADEVQYSLHLIGNGAIAHKMSPPTVITTTVNGSEAAWMIGPYILAYGDGGEENWQSRYLVSGKVLVWTEGDLTYRLESDLTMDEAIRMAESLK